MERRYSSTSEAKFQLPIWGYELRLLFLFLKSGKGIALCIEQVLDRSGVDREDVNYISAHATSTPTGDLAEYQALVRCFGKNPEVK
jgi:3-oxoacyl-(acyl-carrier-protein) synthase